MNSNEMMEQFQEQMQEMMGTMMQGVMQGMMQNFVSMFGSMMQGMMPQQPTQAAEQVDKPANKTKQIPQKMSWDDWEAEEASKEKVGGITKCATFGIQQGVSKEGKPYSYIGWDKFPGKQLYYVNDFYLTTRYDLYHPGKTTSYRMRINDAEHRAALRNYAVRSEVAAEDAKAFQAYMAAKQEKRRQQNLTDESWTSWVG